MRGEKEEHGGHSSDNIAQRHHAAMGNSRASRRRCRLSSGHSLPARCMPYNHLGLRRRLCSTGAARPAGICGRDGRRCTYGRVRKTLESREVCGG
nr:unnamed protein product [Digitaria exilis]